MFLLLFSFLSFSSAYTFHGCALAPNSNHGWVVASDTPSVFHSWDGGLSWEHQYIPTIREFYDVFFIDSLKGWTANRLALIWHTRDGGLTWHWQQLGGAYFAFQVFFLDSLFGWVAASEATSIRTTDGGASWETIFLYPPLPPDTVDFYGISFADTLKGWMCAGRYPIEWGNDTIFKKGQGFIVHSENGGDSWVLQKRDTIYDFFDVKFKDSLEGWVVGGNDSTMEAVVYHTLDGGLSWDLVTVPQGSKILHSLELIDSNKLWAVGRNGTIIHSSNGGDSWEIQISGVDTTFYDVDFSDSLRGLIAGDGVVLYTQDGGNTWFQANVVGMESPTIRRPDFQIIAYPNPFSKKITIRFMPNVLYNELKIYDVTGKFINSFSTNPQSLIPDRCFVWDGCDNAGNEVRPGVYFAIFEKFGFDSDNSHNQKLQLVKVR